jgi:hypothetical protein
MTNVSLQSQKKCTRHGVDKYVRLAIDFGSSVLLRNTARFTDTDT